MLCHVLVYIELYSPQHEVLTQLVRGYQLFVMFTFGKYYFYIYFPS